jgi:hypothetical protein
VNKYLTKNLRKKRHILLMVSEVSVHHGGEDIVGEKSGVPLKNYSTWCPIKNLPVCTQTSLNTDVTYLEIWFFGGLWPALISLVATP